MKHFPSIISKLFYDPVMITPQKHAAICSVIESHMAKSAPMMMEDDDEGDTPEREQFDYHQFGDVALIPVHGVIEKHMVQMMSAAPGCDLDTLTAMIANAEIDSSVKKIGFDFRTPGGSVVGIPEAARRILHCSKDTFAFVDDQCCSGGVYLASQCQRWYSTGSAQLGSIGVWCAYTDWSRNLANEGINIQAISAGKYKLMGAYWKTLTPEETAIIQKDVDKIWAQFKTAVCAVRPISEDAMGNGLIYDGQEAADRGLIDGVVENLDEVLDEMVE